jgi:hypothetical protein
MSEPRPLQIAGLPAPMNPYSAARHLLTGVLIGVMVLAVLFVLV